MAKGKTSIFELFSMICAVNFIGLVALVGSMFGFGIISKSTFKDMIFVFRGAHVTLADKEYERLLKVEADAKEMAKVLQKEKGGGYIYRQSKAAKDNQEKAFQEQVDIDLERLQLEVDKNEKLRAKIEAIKSSAREAIAALAAEKERNTQYGLAEKTKRLQKTMANMDPADIARDLEEFSKGSGGNPEYAAHVLSLLKPSQVSEVLTEIDSGVRQKILPILENKYANMDPDAVVNEWKNAKPQVSARQISVYFRSMPPTQMMRIWRKLDRILREDVLELMAPMQQDLK